MLALYVLGQFKRRFGLFCAALALITAPAFIQAQGSTCEPVVARALEAIGQNCDGLPRNSACYGYTQVDAQFTRVGLEEAFRQPADRTELASIQRIQTSPLNFELDEWGIAVLNVQANLPQILPGQSVTFLLIGEVSLENQAVLQGPVFPVIVTTSRPADLRLEAAETAEILLTIPAQTAVAAYATTSDGTWIRVGHEDVYGWLPRMAFSGSEQARLENQLPIEDGGAPQPMQAFTVRTGLGGVQCAEAPPSLMVMQGPQNVRINLTVNGAAVEIASTILLFQTAPDILRLVTADGTAQFENGDEVPRGWLAEMPIDEITGQTLGDWGGIRPLTTAELDALRPLEQFPSNLLNYPIDIPDEGAAPTPTRVPTRRPPTPAPPTLTPSPTPFVNFTVDRTPINQGECTIVRWQTEHIDSVYFEGVGTVGNAEQQVCPRETEVYQLLVRFRDGTERIYEVRVEVIPPTTAPYCGDLICDPNESSTSCPTDCPPVCGNNICEPGESARTCPNDCTVID